MSERWLLFQAWWLHSILGGGMLLLLTWWLMQRCRQPARRQRLGECGMMAALLLAVLSLAPPWLIVPVLLSPPTAETPDHGPLPPADSVHSVVGNAAARAPPVAVQPPQPALVAPPILALDGRSAAITTLLAPLPEPTQPPLRETSPAPRDVAKEATAARPEFPWSRLATWICAVYAMTALLLLGRWLLGHYALRRILRHAAAAPLPVTGLFAAMTAGRRRPRLLVSHRLRVPISCGLWRPTVIVPAHLCEPRHAERLRWIFAHELTHLERRDAWASLLFGLGQVVYFAVPWFWWLRRQVRLCQEYVADAAAAEQTTCVEDYAQFLLSLTAMPAAAVPATGVVGNSSDLFRRVTMLLQSPLDVEKRCPRWWSFAAASGLLSLAVLGSGIGLRAMAAPVPEDEKKVIIVTTDKDGAVKADASKKVITVIAKDGEIVKQVPVEKKIVVIAQHADGVKQVPMKVEGKVTVVLPDGTVKKAAGTEVGRILFTLVDDEDQKKEKKSVKKETEKRSRTWTFDFDIDGVLKNLPDNVDKEQLRKEIQKAMEQARKAIEMAKEEARKAGEGAPEARKAAAEALRNLQKQQGQLSQHLQQRLRALTAEQRAVAEAGESGQGRLGVNVEPPSPTLADQLDLPEGRGLVVMSVRPESPAAKAGIKLSDVLLEVAGKPVTNDPEGLVKQVHDLNAGTAIDIVVLRKGKKETIRGVKLSESEGRRRVTIKDGPQAQFFGAPGPKIQGFKLNFPEGQAGHGVMTTTFRTDDSFTTRHQEGSLIITITGKIDEGQAKVSEIQVQDGSATKKYRGVDQVPEQYRAKVKNLVEMNEKSNIKIDIKTSTKEKEKRAPRKREKQEEEEDRPAPKKAVDRVS